MSFLIFNFAFEESEIILKSRKNRNYIFPVQHRSRPVYFLANYLNLEGEVLFIFKSLYSLFLIIRYLVYSRHILVKKIGI